jgi:hypothetical protein
MLEMQGSRLAVCTKPDSVYSVKSDLCAVASPVFTFECFSSSFQVSAGMWGAEVIAKRQ